MKELIAAVLAYDALINSQPPEPLYGKASDVYLELRPVLEAARKLVYARKKKRA